MIIVRIDAGLGNQMLQYATYVALKCRYPNTSVAVDIKKYSYARIHNGLELERIFPIHLNVRLGRRTLKVPEIGRYLHFVTHRLNIAFLKVGNNQFHFIKDTGTLNKDLFDLDLKKNYYLEGQWGNEKYFENVKAMVLRDFTFKNPLDTCNEDVAKKIISQNSISVHIRRGDYVGGNPYFVDLSRTSYYENACSFFAENFNTPVFYIFSDDAEWCRKNLDWLKIHKHYFVQGNKGDKSYVDMQLMSLCKHNITANSTFSWWGGWLNKNPNKIVICPRNLFYDRGKNTRIVSEFYPNSWKIME